jgi:hypothetical protein
MGIFFSKDKNIQQNYDKISIEPTQEPVQEPIKEVIQEPIKEVIQEPVQEPIQYDLENIPTHIINKDLKKEIHSNPLLQFIKHDKHIDKENVHEHKNKHNKHKNKKREKKRN